MEKVVLLYLKYVWIRGGLQHVPGKVITPLWLGRKAWDIYVATFIRYSLIESCQYLLLSVFFFSTPSAPPPHCCPKKPRSIPVILTKEQKCSSVSEAYPSGQIFLPRNSPLFPYSLNPKQDFLPWTQTLSFSQLSNSKIFFYNKNNNKIGCNWQRHPG